ncbi:unnamed protein product [Ostreobium quekettii]|uniref:Carbohydrate kinase PfkB domain-containing protein n=1 Tax=Ostreobium quekettii TaxID=121088 RepID=A0A8S1IZ07_9CHLO|nr:unnamed protein product [Ostreobium quekettii]
MATCTEPPAHTIRNMAGRPGRLGPVCAQRSAVRAPLLKAQQGRWGWCVGHGLPATRRPTPSSGCRFAGLRVLCRGDQDGRVEVVCLGESLFDMLANDFDVPREEVKSWTPKAGGATLNVATAVARLGGSVQLITALGNDERGDQLFQLLNDRGVNLEGVLRRAEPTRDVYVERTSAGERTFCGFGLPTTQYCDCFLEIEKVPNSGIKGASVVVMGTLGLAYPTTAASMRKAMEVAHSEGGLVLVDVNWRPVFFEKPESARPVVEEFVQQADIVKLTDEEVEWLFGIDANNVFQDPCKVHDMLPNAKGVLVTGGPKGAAYCFSAGKVSLSGSIPAYPVEVLDTTGAGDAFTAGFIHKLLQAGGLDALTGIPEVLDNAVRFASACGGITTTKPGAVEAQPEAHQVEELIAAVGTSVK